MLAVIELDGWPFVGKLPSEAFAFAPRHLTVEDLARIENEFLQSAIVRKKPEPTAKGQPMPLDPKDPFSIPFAYNVVEVQGDWILIEPFEQMGPRGWVRARVGSLREKLPELSFVEAIVAYLRYRVAQEGGGPDVPFRTISGQKRPCEDMRLRVGRAEPHWLLQ